MNITFVLIIIIIIIIILFLFIFLTTKCSLGSHKNLIQTLWTMCIFILNTKIKSFKN